MAMVSYRSHSAYGAKFGRKPGERLDFGVEDYLQYQGDTFNGRFDAASFVNITRQMDTHDVGRGRGGHQAALAKLWQPVTVIGIDSDALYPPCEQRELAELIPSARLEIVASPEGHDGFLLEQDQVGRIIQQHLDALDAP